MAEAKKPGNEETIRAETIKDTKTKKTGVETKTGQKQPKTKK